MNPTWFGIIKYDTKGSFYFYEQPGFSIALPEIGIDYPKGLLLKETLENNLIVVSNISNHLDQMIYIYPSKLGLLVKIYSLSSRGEVLFEGEIKFITEKKLFNRIRIFFLRMYLKSKKKDDIALMLKGVR